MVEKSIPILHLLERRSAGAFFLGGGLLLASPTHVVLERFLDVPLPSWVVVLFVVPGLIVSLLGLLGLYPRLAESTPRLALAGGAMAGVGVLIPLSIATWMLGGTLLTAVAGQAVSQPPAILFQVMAVAMALGFGCFGVATLRTPVPPRKLGYLLLSYAVPWVVVLGSTAVYGSALPGWLVLTIYGPLPFLMLTTGYTLHAHTVQTRRAETGVDVVTS